ncbi:MAG: hypothetical protein AB1505_05075 [Candidatus Latescibacterota bacterium]
MIRDLCDPGIDRVIQRHRQYWGNEEARGADGSGARPLFRFDAPSPLMATPDPHPLEPPPPLGKAAFHASVEQSYQAHGLMADDLIRMLGTGITSEVLVGCRIMVRAGTHWAEPAFHDWHQFDGYRVADTVWYRRLMENTERALEAVDPARYPFCCMAFRGPVDMAEALLTGERLCEAAVYEPGRLRDLLERITDIIIETATAHGHLLPRFRGGQFNSYGIWAPGSTVTFTLDGGCLFSPALYEDLFLPCDRRLCAAFEAPFVHLHAAARQHFLSWAQIDNLGLQCVIDQAWLPEGRNQPIGPQLAALLPLFAKLRQRKSLMLYGYWEQQTLDLACRSLPSGGCAITGMVADPESQRARWLRPTLTGETPCA